MIDWSSLVACTIILRIQDFQVDPVKIYKVDCWSHSTGINNPKLLWSSLRSLLCPRLGDGSQACHIIGDNYLARWNSTL